MEITWLGQAGLLFETETIRIMIDPYFSNSCEKRNARLKRHIPIREEFTKMCPDILILTHNHLDHTDPETLCHYLNDNTNVTVICSREAQDLVLRYPGNHNCVIFEPGTQWTQDGIRMTAVEACHSEPSAFGVILEMENRKYYITGDTLYNTKILKGLPDDIDVVFLPINGVGNNMNLKDASRFARDCKARWAVPMHWGMFDEINPQRFEHSGRVIPHVYEKISFLE